MVEVLAVACVIAAEVKRQDGVREKGAETDWEKRRKKNLILYLKSNKSNGEKIIYHCGRPMSIVHPSLSP